MVWGLCSERKLSKMGCFRTFKWKLQGFLRTGLGGTRTWLLVHDSVSFDAKIFWFYGLDRLSSTTVLDTSLWSWAKSQQGLGTEGAVVMPKTWKCDGCIILISWEGAQGGTSSFSTCCAFCLHLWVLNFSPSLHPAALPQEQLWR